MTKITTSKPIFLKLINLILVIGLGISAAKLMWLALTPVKQISPRVEANSPLDTQVKINTNYGKIISSHHLFGEITKTPVVSSAPTTTINKSLTPTKLNLTLHGIVAYQSKNGFALISSPNKPQEVYEKGQKISDGVFVDDIYPNKVTLNNRGRIEELLLPVDELVSTPSTTPYQAPNSSIYNKSGLSSVINTSANKPVDLAAIRQSAFKNPQKLMDIIRPFPAVVNGQFLGYRIIPGRNRQVFRQLGFRRNDIIQEVNNIVLDDPSKGVMLLGELSQASSVSVRIKRGNRIIDIQHQF